MKKILFVATSLFVLNSCTEKKNDPIVEGKVKRDVIAFAPKVTGRILEIRVEEGDQVHVGDTLAVLDVPEAKAKLSQVQGLLKSAEAQKNLSPKRCYSKPIKATSS